VRSAELRRVAFEHGHGYDRPDQRHDGYVALVDDVDPFARIYVFAIHKERESMSKSLRTAALSAAVSAVALCASGSAMAAGPTGEYAQFKNCPYTNPAVEVCVYSRTTSGSFKLGNASVPITASTPIYLQGGAGSSDVDGNSVFYNAVGTDTLSKTKLKVPGGLVGLVNTGGWSGILIDLFNAAVASVNDVYATAELVGPVKFNAPNFLSGANDTAIELPVRVHLENPFLGSNCYIGSSGNPVRLKLRTGTTSPPPPNTPITGSPGTLSITGGGGIINFADDKLVDNSFAAPAATNCGYLLLDRLIITAAVNLKEGLPAAAGKNTAILQGDNHIGITSAVLASIP
jgi:hypothetical protein